MADALAVAEGELSGPSHFPPLSQEENCDRAAAPPCPLPGCATSTPCMHAINAPSSPAWGRDARGGILRNHMGDIIFAFSAIYQGVCSSLEAEALALRNGIILCYEKGISDFLVESDSLVLVQMMKGNYSIPWRLSIITQDILYRCQHIHVSLSHIYREANQVADTLAGFGCTITSSYCVWSSWADLPPSVKGPYRLDKMGLPSIRP
ncbi:hypothetical protein Taro_050938 [Colocasia esculenta]|uniref:RNase H type-1 domain-containing protein n=1 Tax=Colocasia esculenta TaxID=4460 RepID=A0A843XF54_COLES|nr:hypothetical protein [Colocasia esculenta]